MTGGHLSWLASRERFGVKLGLDAMRVLLADLGNPQDGLPTVLVAGTNGKGSTAAMTAALLTAAGRRTILYTSPHVASVCERIRVDGRNIRRDVLERRLGEVRTAVQRLTRRGRPGSSRRLPQQPTYFEVLTAAALLQARACRATAAVFEIGLGGRFDATNVIPAPVAVITGIDRDHTGYLGTTLKKIAWNKAGIIKTGQTVLTLEPRPELLQVFREECRRVGATLVPVPARSARPSGGSRRRETAAGAARDPRWDLDLAVVRRLTGGENVPPHLDGVRLGLRGPRQGAQAVLAMAAAMSLMAAPQQEMSSRHLPGAGGPRRRESRSRLAPVPALRRALAGVRLPGRFERRQLSRRRLLIADAAHNPAAAEALAAEVQRQACRRPIILLFGALDDKDAAAMLRPFLKFVDNVNLTLINSRRSLKKKKLKEIALKPGGTAMQVFSDPAAAWTATLAAAPRGGIVLVTGSFYLLGDLWPRIRRYPLLP